MITPMLFISYDLFASFPVELNDCDIIILESGDEISVKVIEITPDLIKYKYCDKENSPLISVYKKDVFMIKYFDGTKEKINHDENSSSLTRKKELLNKGVLMRGDGSSQR